MPTINIKRELLFERLGKSYTDEEFDALCFEFGIELDEITSEKKMAAKEKGIQEPDFASEEVIYKIDVPANRYDLLSLEGLVQAIKIFIGTQSPPDYVTNKSNIQFHVDAHALAVRPILIGAVIRNVELYQSVYDSFIDLQDKIHQNIGRKRSLVSIGTHDLDKVQGPFYYTACPPTELKFVPLNQTREFTGLELMDFYADSHLKPYLPLIKDKPRYPVIYDKNKVVLSMPPIINGDTSKISLDTRNILIEITATDLAKATIALDTIVTMLVSSVAAQEKYHVESVTIHTGSEVNITPNLDYHKEVVDKDYINRGLGLNLSAEEISKLLMRMGIKAKPDQDKVAVEIPPTRHDIINKCDVMEDVGIAYGYDNIAKTLPRSSTIATQIPLNKLTDSLRNEIARCGYTEALTFALCSEEQVSTLIRSKTGLDNAIKIKNPKTLEFQVARTCLIPGLLKTINSNKKAPLPIKLFEISDVVLRSDRHDVKAKNERHLAAVFYGNKASGFEVIHGLLDRIMHVLEIPYTEDGEKSLNKEGYYIKSAENELYLTGRCASIICKGKSIGYMGILHPEVICNFDLNMPCSAIEFQLEDFPFLRYRSKNN